LRETAGEVRRSDGDWQSREKEERRLFLLPFTLESLFRNDGQIS
jgi:hypothetical protein